MKLRKKHLTEYLEFALKTASKADLITTKYYSRKIKHRIKDNNSPVTIADLKCEDYILSKIKKSYPSHNIYAEESGIKNKGSEFRWFIDPIDGTKNFMRKYPFWGTLIALEYQGEIVLGIISMPAIKEMIFAAKGMGCYYNGKKTKVSKIRSIEDSYLLHGGMEYIVRQQYRDNFFYLAGMSYYCRGFGDCHGHSFVINGRAEILVDPHVAPYDIAATKICIEEAGGVLTDLNGDTTIYGGNAVITNGRLHEKVLEILNKDIESRDITKQ